MIAPIQTVGFVLSLLTAAGIVPPPFTNGVLPESRPAATSERRNVPTNVEPSPARSLRLGVGLLDAGQADLAADALADAFGTPLDDFAHVSLGRALLQSGRAAEAVEHFAAVRTDPYSPWRPLAARLYPDALRAAGDLRRARRAYETLLERYAELPDRPTVLLSLAGVWRDLDRARDEARVLADLVWEFPDSTPALKAEARLAELRAARVRVPTRDFGDYVDRAATYRYERRYADAHADLDAAAALVGRSSARRELLRDERIRTWRRAMDWDALIAALEPALGQRPEQDVEEGLLLSEALRRAGRVDDGLAVLKRLSRKSRKVSREDLAEAYLQEGRLDEADALYQRVLRRRLKRTARRFSTAWLHYRMGRLDDAVAGFAEVARRKRRGRTFLKASYWHARALQDAGRADEAVAAFRAVAAEDPRDYYAYLARSRLLELGQPDDAYAAAAERLGSLDQLTGGRAAPAANRLASVTTSNPVRPDAIRRAADAHGEILPRLERAALLHEMNRRDDARRELRYLLAEIDWLRAHPRAVSRLIGRPLSPFLDRRREPLGVWGEDLTDRALRVRLRREAWKEERRRLVAVRDLPREAFEDLREAFRAADDAWGVRRTTFKLEWYSKGVPDDENRRYYMDTNPLAWREHVIREAERRGLDPAFVWAIMTVESAYNETAHSVADARGLMQLLPRTGWLVARDLGEPAPHPTDLLEPARNVRYGAWYLSRLAERFQGQDLFAAAAYNAGPHRIAWRIERDAALPFDVVLEDLPSWAGREYAKKVLGFLGHYRRVYLDDSVVYVGNRTLPPVDGINY